MNNTQTEHSINDLMLFQKFSEIVGQENVFEDQDKISNYYWSTGARYRRIKGVVRPASLSEIQSILKICNEYQVACYPISSGKNWGYGSAIPTAEDNIILDLSRLNKIIEVNSELAYAVIEPGVTQGQLVEYLKQHNIPLYINTTGAGPNVSIVGNMLERGFALGRCADRFGAVCGMEVVLSDGQVLEEGFRPFAQAKCKHTFRYGPGPAIDGIFSQSNFGIVTKLGFWLDRTPDYFGVLFFSFNEPFFEKTIDTVRELLLAKQFPGSLNLVHQTRILTTKMQYPWSQGSGAFEELAKNLSVAPWTCIAPIFGTRAMINAHLKTIRAQLKQINVKTTFLSQDKLKLRRLFKKVTKIFEDTNSKKELDSVEEIFAFLQGIPTELALSTPYWRNTKIKAPQKNINPAKDRCGLIWFSPIVPAIGAEVAKLGSMISSIMKDFALDYCPTFTAVYDRSFICTLPILYNREDPEEEARALSCYKVLLNSCIAAGYPPYRLNTHSMSESIIFNNPYWAMINKIKHALDPNNIIAPGRYQADNKN